MRGWFVVAAVALAAVIVVVGAGCGGGGGKPKLDRATLEAMLTEIAPTLDDLPPNLAVTEESFQTNEEAAVNDPDGPTAALKRYEDEGRLLGRVGAYTTNDPFGTFTKGGDALVTVSTTIYEDSKGAAAAMDYLKELMADPGRTQATFEGVTDLQGEPMSFASIGDDTVAYRFTGVFHPADIQVNVNFIAHAVGIRQGQGVSTLIVAAIGGATPGPEVEELTRKLDERMAEALR
ncbi:MAG: hypothetical protein Q8P50_11920 [Bacillota bacterium]|nr:hypothetical protein [Bacillota bacterium]